MNFSRGSGISIVRTRPFSVTSIRKGLNFPFTPTAEITGFVAANPLLEFITRLPR